MNKLREGRGNGDKSHGKLWETAKTIHLYIYLDKRFADCQACCERIMGGTFVVS